MAEKKVQEYVEVKSIGERQHPDYAPKLDIWEFLLASYRGGMGMQGRRGKKNVQEEEKQTNGYYAGLFKWRKENSDDYIKRVSITPYRPYARRIVDAFVNYITKEEPKREEADNYEDFLGDVDRHKTTMKKFVRRALIRQKVLGVFNVLVDKPKATREYKSKADEKADGQRPYCVPILPQSIKDWSIGDNGKYEWVIIETSTFVNDINKEKQETVCRRTYWDEQYWQIYEKNNDKWELIDAGEHPCGEVPIIRIEFDDIDDNVESPESWFYDLADMNRLIYNLESIDVVNFHNQCFGQLILPGTRINTEEEAKKASTSEAWTETPDENGISRFIQTTGIEHSVIEEKIKSCSVEMYRISGLYHRTESKMAETAKAKEWDHEEMNQFLASFAGVAEFIEQEILRLYGKWSKTEITAKIKYPDNYKVEELELLIASILDLKQIGFSSEIGRKELIKHAFREILGKNVTPEVIENIEKEVDESEPLKISIFDDGKSNEKEAEDN